LKAKYTPIDYTPYIKALTVIKIIKQELDTHVKAHAAEGNLQLEKTKSDQPSQLRSNIKL
jgi:hypothetical protein